MKSRPDLFVVELEDGEYVRVLPAGGMRVDALGGRKDQSLYYRVLVYTPDLAGTEDCYVAMSVLDGARVLAAISQVGSFHQSQWVVCKQDGCWLMARPKDGKPVFTLKG